MQSQTPILSLSQVSKRYRDHVAVDNISFEVPKSKLFGLLGPNGAGKTSLIRIITSITAADEGKVILDGEVIRPEHALKLGYMPEERGLYKKMKVGEQLLYLSQLKGMGKSEAIQAINSWMTKFEIKDWINKKIEELSKGMQQKIQFIATVVHDPKVIILDEPFSGLDPINTNLIKEEIRQLKEKGASIIFSTHRMEQVEEICESIVLMNQGKVILEGEVADLKERFKENLYELSFRKNNVDIDSNQLFDIVDKTASSYTLKLKNAVQPNEALSYFLQTGNEIKSYKELLPSLNQIFIKQVESNNNG